MARFTGDGPEDPLFLERAVNIGGMAIMGAIGGARTPVGPGPTAIAINPITGALAGGAVGAIGGTFAPEASLEAMESLGLIPEGTRDKIGLSNEELRAVAEAEALIDLTLGGTMQAGALVTRGGIRLMAGLGRGEAELAEEAAKEGVELPAFVAGSGRAARFFSTVFGRFPIVGTPLRREAERAGTEIEKAINRLPGRIGELMSESSIGQRIATEANELVTMVGKDFDARYIQLFEDAEQAGIRILPRNVLAKGDEIVQRIASETPPVLEGTPNPGQVLSKVQTFIEAEIFSLRAQTAIGTARAKMTLRQLDGLFAKIDQEIASFEPGQKRFARALLSQLKTAAKLDGVSNISGSGARQIGERLQTLDREFSQTMSALFETATAKRFGRVQRQGLRGTKIDPTTRTPIDQLAKVVVDLNSPQAMRELSRLVGNDTMKAIAARSVKTIFERGFSVAADGERIFRANQVAKSLGLSFERGPRGRGLRFAVDDVNKADAMKELLSHTDLGMKQILTILNAAQRLGSAPIPDVSTFIARGAVIGGVTSVFRKSLPGIAFGSSLIEGLVGFVMFAGGGRGMARLLTDPLAARSLKTVLKPTAQRANRKVNWLRALRTVLNGLTAETEITPPEATAIFRDGIDFVRGFKFPEGQGEK